MKREKENTMKEWQQVFQFFAFVKGFESQKQGKVENCME